MQILRLWKQCYDDSFCDGIENFSSNTIFQVCYTYTWNHSGLGCFEKWNSFRRNSVPAGCVPNQDFRNSYQFHTFSYNWLLRQIFVIIPTCYTALNMEFFFWKFSHSTNEREDLMFRLRMNRNTHNHTVQWSPPRRGRYKHYNATRHSRLAGLDIRQVYIIQIPNVSASSKPHWTVSRFLIPTSLHASQYFFKISVDSVLVKEETKLDRARQNLVPFQNWTEFRAIIGLSYYSTEIRAIRIFVPFVPSTPTCVGIISNERWYLFVPLTANE